MSPAYAAPLGPTVSERIDPLGRDDLQATAGAVVVLSVGDGRTFVLSHRIMVLVHLAREGFN